MNVKYPQMRGQLKKNGKKKKKKKTWCKLIDAHNEPEPEKTIAKILFDNVINNNQERGERGGGQGRRVWSYECDPEPIKNLDPDLLFKDNRIESYFIIQVSIK